MDFRFALNQIINFLSSLVSQFWVYKLFFMSHIMAFTYDNALSLYGTTYRIFQNQKWIGDNRLYKNRILKALRWAFLDLKNETIYLGNESLQSKLVAKVHDKR